MSRIVLLGATGYTGRLIAERLAGGKVETVLAGRSADSLAALADELGGTLATATVRLDNPRTIADLLEPGDVLATTVGSFMKVGDPALAVAIERGAHYLDTTGEAAFVRRIFSDPTAQSAAGALVTAMGYDYAPGNLAGALAVERASELTTEPVAKLDIGYFFTGETQGALSGGTMASATGVLLSPGFTWRDGRLITERPGARTRTWDVEGVRVPSLTLGSSEAITLPLRYPQLKAVDVYQGGLGAATPVLSHASRLAAIPGAARTLNALSGYVIHGSTGGPDAATRARSGTHVIANALSTAGHLLSQVVLRGPNVYDITADLTAWGAERAAAGEVHGSGPLGPVQAFGLDALHAAHLAAGMTEGSQEPPS